MTVLDPERPGAAVHPASLLRPVPVPAALVPVPGHGRRARGRRLLMGHPGQDARRRDVVNVLDAFNRFFFI